MDSFESANLHEFDKDEWWDIIRYAVRSAGRTPPTREQFDADWGEFQEIKRRRALN